MELVFNWQSSQDYSGATSILTYKITDISNASSTLSTIETASTTAKISINEIDRDYNFSIQAFDKDGFGSATSTNSISVPDLPEETPPTQIVLSQTESSTSTTPLQIFHFYQSLGNNLSIKIKSIEIYGQSNRTGRWLVGICRATSPIHQCPDNVEYASIVSNESIVQEGQKTLLTFTFPNAITLESGVTYALYVRPWEGPNFNYAESSIYGASSDTYTDGALYAYERIPGYGGYINSNLGISDAYFVFKE